MAVAIRLKIANGLIAEAEQLILRSSSDTMGMTGKLSVGESVEKMGKPHEIYRDAIRRIEAIFHRCPYGMNSGWSTYEQGMSDQIQSIR